MFKVDLKSRAEVLAKEFWAGELKMSFILLPQIPLPFFE